MSDESTKIAVCPAESPDAIMDALLEELRQAQAEMERLRFRVTKLLGSPK